MSFERPYLLLSLVVIGLAALFWLWAERRRMRYAVRFTNLEVLAGVVGGRAWRGEEVDAERAVRQRRVQHAQRVAAAIGRRAVDAVDSVCDLKILDLVPDRLNVVPTRRRVENRLREGRVRIFQACRGVRGSLVDEEQDLVHGSARIRTLDELAHRAEDCVQLARAAVAGIHGEREGVGGLREPGARGIDETHVVEGDQKVGVRDPHGLERPEENPEVEGPRPRGDVRETSGRVVDDAVLCGRADRDRHRRVHAAEKGPAGDVAAGDAVPVAEKDPTYSDDVGSLPDVVRLTGEIQERLATRAVVRDRKDRVPVEELQRSGLPHDPRDLEPLTGTPLLARVPASAFPGAAPDPQLPIVFQTLRDSLTYFNLDVPLTSLLVMSPIKGDGKTSVATHLAVAYARAGKRVILLDADLRGPQVAVRMGGESSPGLSEVLTGGAETEEALQEIEPFGSDLRILAGGSVPPNPSEMLGSARMTTVLAQLADMCDLVLVDTAPLLVVSDAFPLLDQVAGIVGLARLEQTSRDAVERAIEVSDKAGGRVLGMVATGGKPGEAYGYGYGYTYGKAYGQAPETGLEAAPASTAGDANGNTRPEPATGAGGRVRRLFRSG